MKKRAGLLAFSVFCFILAITGDSIYGDEVALFQKTYVSATGAPQVVTDTFSVAPGSSNFSLIVQNGKDGENRVSSAVVSINGVQILRQSDFNRHVHLITRSISLVENNTISVQLGSAPGSFISLKIVAEISNTPPVADAGPDQTVFVGSTVTLDGSRSSDADGDILTWHWSFQSVPSGSTASLSNPDSSNPFFVADKSGTYVVQLIVNDGKVDSTPSVVIISTGNSRPVANAGLNQTVFVGTVVTLDGSKSSDVDGDSLTFSWNFVSKPATSVAVISDITSVNPTFVIDVPGNYVVQLVVNDGTIDSLPATVTITTANSTPVANTGADQTAYVGDTVTLDGSKSSDVDGDSLTFRWSFVSKPVGSMAELSDPFAVDPTFVIDEPGTYVIQLIVNDGTVDSVPASVNITTLNSKPVAEAGPDQNVIASATVTLDGSGSYDADQDSLTYQWSFTSVPPQSSAVLSDPSAASPSFMPDWAGMYVAQLIVNDGKLDSNPDTIVITATEPIPVLTSITPNSVLAGGPAFSLQLSGSNFMPGFFAIFNGQSLATTYVNPVELDAVVPSSLITTPGTYPVTVLNSSRQSSNALNLTVENPVPELNSLNPATVPADADAVITLTGSGDVPNSVASIDGNILTTAFIDSKHLNISIPASLLTVGDHSITVSNPLPGGGSSGVLVLAVTTPTSEIPPDPVTVAPPLDTTVSTTILSSTEFLYSGDNPIQTGMVPGTIDVKFAAVIRGRVLKTDGSVLPGVNISILNHSEFGNTVSRSDGAFDMAVNGGGVLTVRYDMPGYLSVQRQVNVPWQDYAAVPDVVMTQLDGNVNTIDLSSTTPVQVARGSVVTDNDGTRQATLLFQQGTTAIMTFPDGSTQPLTKLSVRATEYTVGPNGPAAMPGELPPNVAYTYAVELSVDAAIAAGAKNVQFSQPVISYNENFLNFPAGTLVPSGYYERDRGVWVPSRNGLVVKILSISNGTANLDIDGSNTVAGPEALAALGITNAELVQLAALYQPGQSLWRVPITHFSPWDFNWGLIPPPDATGPDQPPPSTGPPTGDPTPQCGSVIECQTQTLGERVKITGTPYSLNYRSSRVPGARAAYTLKIPLSGSSIPGSLLAIHLEISVAGRTFEVLLSPLINKSYVFTWDGLDAYGRQTQGAQPVTTRIGYVYQGIIIYCPLGCYGGAGGGGGGGTTIPANYDEIFGHFTYFGIPSTGDRTRGEITLWQTNHGVINVGHWNSRAQGLGSWTLNVQHAYEPSGKDLYFGDGTYLSARDLNIREIDSFAGNGNSGYNGDGGPALQASLNLPNGMATDRSGNIYIADTSNQRIRKIDTNGTITTIAGNGSAGYSGDGGPASQASLNQPTGVAVDGTGNIYIADTSNQRIRKIDTNGIITTITGNGSAGYSGNGVPAIQASLNSPSGVAVDSAGNLYIADTSNHRLRNVDPSGVIVTVAGNGSAGYSGDGGPASQASLNQPTGVAVDGTGNIYIADTSNQRIRKIDIGGTITTVAGNGGVGYSGDGGQALQAPSVSI